MSDAEIIKAEDFLGNEINIGDEVIFEAPKYRDFVVGKVITKAEKTCQIEYVNDWNYPRKGRTEVVRQYYCQIIKHPDILINRQKAENERLKSILLCFMDEVTKWENKYCLDVSELPLIPIKGESKKIKNRIKAEAMKEFAYKLQDRCLEQGGCIYASDIGAVLNEMAGDTE